MCIILGGPASARDTSIVHLSAGDRQYLMYSNLMQALSGGGPRSLFLVVAVRKDDEDVGFATTADPSMFEFLKALVPGPPVARSLMRSAGPPRSAKAYSTPEADAVLVPDWDASYERFESFLQSYHVEMGKALYEEIVSYYRQVLQVLPRRLRGAAPDVEFRALLVMPRVEPSSGVSKLKGVFVSKADTGLVHVPMLDVHDPVAPLKAEARYDHRLLICSDRRAPGLLSVIPVEDAAGTREDMRCPIAWLRPAPAPEGDAESIAKFFRQVAKQTKWSIPRVDAHWMPIGIFGSALNGDLFGEKHASHFAPVRLGPAEPSADARKRLTSILRRVRRGQ